MTRLTLLAPALAAVFLLAGCASASPSAPDSSGAGGEPGVVGEAPDDGSVIDGDRSIVVTGSAVIVAEDPLAAADEAEKLVRAVGGRIDGRSESGPNDFHPGSATLELRIPADRLDDVLAGLPDIGRVDFLRTESADVTMQVRDLDARISALEGSITRLQALMEQASSVDDLIRIESELSRRQGELESLRAQQRVLDEQVAMSTIWIELRAPSDASNPLPDDFGEGVVFGWEAFVAFWAGVLVLLGVLVPWLVTAAIIVLIVVLLVRTRRRARAAATRDAATVAAPAPTAAPATTPTTEDGPTERD